LTFVNVDGTGVSAQNGISSGYTHKIRRSNMGSGCVHVEQIVANRWKMVAVSVALTIPIYSSLTDAV